MHTPEYNRPIAHPEDFYHCVLCGKLATYITWDEYSTWQAPITQMVVNGNVELDIEYDNERCTNRLGRRLDTIYLCNEHKQ